ncbi:MAG: DM13 domain-containing protein [Bacteroidota bacterium]
MKKSHTIGYAILSLVFLLVSHGTFSQSIKKGKFEKQNKSITGTFEIVKKDGGTYVVLSDDFKTKSAPDLKIFLSKKTVASVTGKNATKDAAFVAKLKKSKGGQSYKIPSNVSLANYKSILIHCEEYGVFWGGSNL